MNQMNMSRLSIAFCGHADNVNFSPACAGCPLSQEALFKSQWKIREVSSITEVGGCVVVNQTVDSPPQPVTSDASPALPVSAPWSNLFACLCQRRLRSSCSARSELIDLSSAGSNNISFCRTPQPCCELRNLPSLSSSLKMCHSCTAGCPRSYDRASKGCFGCVVWG